MKQANGTEYILLEVKLAVHLGQGVMTRRGRERFLGVSAGPCLHLGVELVFMIFILFCVSAMLPEGLPGKPST